MLTQRSFYQKRVLSGKGKQLRRHRWSCLEILHQEKADHESIAKYVYYGCTRSRDLHCKGGYIREEELINQLLKVIDKIDVNELGIKQKFDEEMERYRKLRRTVLGLKATMDQVIDINLRTYAKHLLKEGAIQEKRELLSNIKSWLVLKKKEIVLEEKK